MKTKNNTSTQISIGDGKVCYCLTEPSSVRYIRRQKLQQCPNAEGTHYIVNGQKCGLLIPDLVDVFIVFCQIEGNKYCV